MACPRTIHDRTTIGYVEYLLYCHPTCLRLSNFDGEIEVLRGGRRLEYTKSCLKISDKQDFFFLTVFIEGRTMRGGWRKVVRSGLL
jgi:hypothetical protein